MHLQRYIIPYMNLFSIWRRHYYWRKIFAAHKNLYGARKLPTIMIKFMASIGNYIQAC